MLFYNVLYDLYRGFNPANPYQPPGNQGLAVGCALNGELVHHVRHGRFGTGKYLHWTNVLLVEQDTDIRCAYNSQLNAFDPSQADTVIVHDYPIPGWFSAFLVVDVQITDRGLPSAYRRCYLDRARPRQGTPPACGAAIGGGPGPDDYTMPIVIQGTVVASFTHGPDNLMPIVVQGFIVEEFLLNAQVPVMPIVVQGTVVAVYVPGGGGGGAGNACCPSANLPATMFVTVQAFQSGSCGHSFTLTQQDANTWSVTGAAYGFSGAGAQMTWALTLLCSGTTWTLSLTTHRGGGAHFVGTNAVTLACMPVSGSSVFHWADSAALYSDNAGANLCVLNSQSFTAVVSQ